MKKRRAFLWSAAAIAALTLLLTMPRAAAPLEREGSFETEQTAKPADGARGERVEKGCSAIQTMLFSRCGHSVTRRVSVAEKVIGGDFAAVQSYYDVWRIDSFSPLSLEMSREIDLFCPLHWVVSGNEAGEIVLCRNRYGDGMAIEKTLDGYTLEQFSEQDRAAIRQGVGFDSEAEAEAWLSAH